MGNTAAQGGDVSTSLSVAAMQQDVLAKLEDMTPLDTLEQSVKNCSESNFFIALTNEVRQAGSRTQKFLGKLDRIEDLTLGKQLEMLKTEYNTNATQIAEIENRLKIKRDIKLREKIKDCKIFECLNAEKATPLLLNLAKKTGSGDSLNNIRDNNGSNFANETDRNGHISDFYRSLYQPDLTVQGTIEDFLGPVICSHPMVLGSKLTLLEKNHLDRPLDISELDRALQEANMRSAPGVDGYSYRLMQSFGAFSEILCLNALSRDLRTTPYPTSLRLR
jgi:hypothetical protein